MLNNQVFHSENGQSVLILQQPPCIRTVYVRSPLQEKLRRVRLSFPYIVFLLPKLFERFRGLNVAFSPKPVNTVDDLLYYPFLPNISYDLYCCLGQNLPNTPVEIINLFWSTTFYYEHHVFEEVLIHWERKTKKNPDFILKEFPQCFAHEPLKTYTTTVANFLLNRIGPRG